MPVYVKTCKNPRCKKTFESTSRNKAFCSDECQQHYYHERMQRRKKAQKFAEENRILSSAYRLANMVADYVYPDKVCACCGKESTHVHHKDMNPLNNSPENLVRMCEPCHKALHSELPAINMAEVLKTMKDMNKSIDWVVKPVLGNSCRGKYESLSHIAKLSEEWIEKHKV